MDKPNKKRNTDDIELAKIKIPKQQTFNVFGYVKLGLKILLILLVLTSIYLVYKLFSGPSEDPIQTQSVESYPTDVPRDSKTTHVFNQGTPTDVTTTTTQREINDTNNNVRQVIPNSTVTIDQVHTSKSASIYDITPEETHNIIVKTKLENTNVKKADIDRMLKQRVENKLSSTKRKNRSVIAESASHTGYYVAQLVAYKTSAEANKFVKSLKTKIAFKGKKIFVTKKYVKGITMYAVQIGLFKGHDKASSFCKTISKTSGGCFVVGY